MDGREAGKKGSEEEKQTRLKMIIGLMENLTNWWDQSVVALLL